MRGEGGRSSLTDDDTNDPTYHPSEEEESEGEGRPPSTVRYECGEEAKTTFEKIYEDKPGFIPYLPRVLVGVGPKGGVRIVTPGGYAYRVDEKSLVCIYAGVCRPNPQKKSLRAQSLRCQAKAMSLEGLPTHWHGSTSLVCVVSFWRRVVLGFLLDRGPEDLMVDPWWERMEGAIRCTFGSQRHLLSDLQDMPKSHVKKFLVC